MHEYIFDTPRLRARRIGPADVDALHAVYGDADAMRWVGDGLAITLEQCRQWVDVTQRNYATRGYGMFAVEQKPAGNVIGFCGLVHPNGQAEAEIKYAYLREAWGRGIATEAAAALLRYGDAAHGIRHVIATAAPANVASHRVLLKAGMRRAALRSNDDGSFTQLFAWTSQPMPDEVSIEPLRAVDIPAVAELARAIWREHHLKFVSAGQIEYMLRNKYSTAELAPYVNGTDRWFDVVRVEGAICGFLRCIRKDPAELKLEEIYVSQALRGSGVGRKLLALAESRARELRCSFVILYVNRANDTAVRAYRHAGFVVRSELVVDIGNGYVMDDFLMAKSLVDAPRSRKPHGLNALESNVNLVKPDLAFRDSYRGLVHEFVAAGESLVPFVLAFDNVDFSAFLDRLANCARGSDIPAGFVAHSTWWLVRGRTEVVGVANIRHALNDGLRREGGNIGYGIRPSARRQGLGIAILRQSLLRAAELGMPRVLVTCAKANVGSAKSIMRNGGILESEEFLPARGEVVQRFWIETQPGAAG